MIPAWLPALPPSLPCTLPPLYLQLQNNTATLNSVRTLSGPGGVIQACNHNVEEAEAGRSPEVQEQPILYSRVQHSQGYVMRPWLGVREGAEREGGTCGTSPQPIRWPPNTGKHTHMHTYTHTKHKQKKHSADWLFDNLIQARVIWEEGI